MKTYTNFSLKSYNTFGIDAKARRFVDIEKEEDLLDIDDFPAPRLCIGRGSNLLFTKDFDGTVIHCRMRTKNIVMEDTDSVLVEVGAGELWDDFVDYAVSHDWSGVENLSLIPGEVGSAAVQNIGAYGAEVKDVIAYVDYLDVLEGRFRRAYVEDLDYAYRSSRFKTEWKDRCIIYKVAFRLSKQFHPNLSYAALSSLLTPNSSLLTPYEVRKAVIDLRRQKLPDPRQLGNAGSFFMNPVVPADVARRLLRHCPDMPHYPQSDGQYEKLSAAWLIDQCGWKGRTLGRAGVYADNALVLVNLGDATAADIVALSIAIQHDVRQRYGIDIHPEVNFI